MKKRFYISFIMLIAFNLFADDTYMGSVGGNVFPAQSEKIQMVREIVTIRCLRDSCLVTCRFWFFNNGPKEWVQVGFPNYSDDRESDSMPLRHFTAAVNGTPAAVRNASQITTIEGVDPAHRFWFVWEAEFAEMDTTCIENTYVGYYGGTQTSITFDYMIGTGRTWEGPIKNGRILFDYSEAVSDFFVSAHLPPSPYIRRERKGSQIIYSFDNYKPGEDDNLGLEILVCREGMDTNLMLAALGEKIKGRKTARLMRNEIFAQRGYEFHDPELAAYFRQQKWYKPDPGFSPDRMTPHELQFVQMIKQIEETFP